LLVIVLVFLNNHYLSPLVVKDSLKIPILQTINVPLRIREGGALLFYNMNREILGISLEIGDGQLIILPEYKSNEEIIATFLNRVIPKIYETQSKVNIIDLFLSLGEEKIKEEMQKLENEREILDKKFEPAKEKLATATRIKIQTIESDDTANLVLKYHDNALKQDDVALFYLYKIIEVLEKKYGGEKEAKDIIGCNTEWNLIGKVANASYADIRHAPKPGEKIKEWSSEDIKACFEGVVKIIQVYLKTLF